MTEAVRDLPGPLTLHGHFTSLPTGKVALMLRLCGLNFEYREVKLFDDEHHDDAFGALNAFRQVPVLARGDRLIVQSAVILLHLAEETGRFLGRSHEDRTRILEWLFFDSDMVASIRVPRTLTRIFDRPDESIIEYHRQRGLNALRTMEEALAVRPFLCGPEPTIADVAVFPVIDNAGEAGIDVTEFEAVVEWLGRMRSLPGSLNHYDLMACYTRVDMSTTPASRAKRLRGDAS